MLASKKGKVCNMPPKPVAIPVMEPRTQGLPLPVIVPSSDKASASPIEIAAPSEAAVKVSNDAVQIFGGYGYTKDFPVEKFYRDSKLCTIGEGTSEIQKLVIAREVLK